MYKNEYGGAADVKDYVVHEKNTLCVILKIKIY